MIRDSINEEVLINEKQQNTLTENLKNNQAPNKLLLCDSYTVLSVSFYIESLLNSMYARVTCHNYPRTVKHPYNFRKYAKS